MVFPTILVEMAEMDDQVLLKSQKNILFTGIQSFRLSPSDFSLVESSQLCLAELRHESTGYYFNISLTTKGDYSVTFSPGRAILKEIRPDLNWKGVEIHFNVWLERLVCEIEAPDLWATVSGDTQLVRLAADQDNRPFTSDEQLHVKKALAEIKAYLVQSQRLTDEQTRTIQARFDYMEEAATRLGRKDWTGILVSSLIGIVSTLSLSANSTKDLFQFAGQVVRQLLGTVLYLAGPH